VDASKPTSPTPNPADAPEVDALVGEIDESPVGVGVVCRTLGLDRTTVKTYAVREHDPLPLFRIGTRYKCYPSRLRAWMAREAARNAATDRQVWRTRRDSPDAHGRR
jgi:hypothetical protein